jgi:hypothetical protein
MLKTANKLILSVILGTLTLSLVSCASHEEPVSTTTTTTHETVTRVPAPTSTTTTTVHSTGGY